MIIIFNPSSGSFLEIFKTQLFEPGFFIVSGNGIDPSLKNISEQEEISHT